MMIVDSFPFPSGYFASSPQFIPSAAPLAGNDPSKHGFIVCTVLSDNLNNAKESCDEFWVFHADCFQKPIYRLSAPSDRKSLNLALTLHTTWMKEIRSESQQKRYSDINVRQNLRRDSIYEDYQTRLDNAKSVVYELFNDIVYEDFVEQLSEVEATDRLLQENYPLDNPKESI